MVSAISSYAPNLALASPVQMVRNLKFIALPAIAFAGSFFTPTAQAADCDYFECWRNCDAHQDAFPPLILICKFLCGILCK